MSLVTGDNALRFATSIDNRGLRRGSKEAQGILGGLANNVSKMDVFGGLAIGAVMAFTKIAKEAHRLSVEFEQAMREVATISDATAGDFEGMSEKIREIGTEVPQSANQLAKAFYQIASAGYDGSAGIEILRKSAKAAVGGITDVETAADGVTTILNAWKIQAKDADNITDQLFQTVKLGKTTFPELANGISEVASIASSADIPLNEILAAVSSLTKQGVPTSQAFTQIKASIISTNEVLGDGWSKAMSYQEGMQAISDKANGSQNALREMVGRVEAMNAVLALTGDNAEMAANDLSGVSSAAGAASGAFENMIQSHENQVKLLQANVQNEMMVLGDMLRKNSTAVISFINDIFDGRDFQPLLDVFYELYEQMGDIFSSFGELAEKMGLVNSETGDMSGLFELLADAVSLVTTPIRLAQKGLLSFVEAINMILDRFPAIKEGLQSIVQFFEDISNSATDFFNKIENGSKEAVAVENKEFQEFKKSLEEIEGVEARRAAIQKEINEQLRNQRNYTDRLNKLVKTGNKEQIRHTEKVIDQIGTYVNLLKSIDSGKKTPDKQEKASAPKNPKKPAETLNYLEELQKKLSERQQELENLSARVSEIDTKAVQNKNRQILLIREEIKNVEIALGLRDEIKKKQLDIISLKEKEIKVTAKSEHNIEKLIESLRTQTAKTDKIKVDWESVSINIADSATLASDLSSSFEGLNDDISASLASLSDYLGSITNLISGAASGNFLQAASGLVSLVTQIAKDSSKNKTNQESITDFISRQNKLLEIQIALIGRLKGGQGLEAYKNSLQQIETNLNSIQEKYQENVEFLEQVNYLSDEIDYSTLLQDIAEFSETGVKNSNLQAFLDAGGDINKIIGDAGNEYAELVRQQKELQAQLYEALTGTTSDSITDSILQGFENGKLAAEDFADNFEDLMRSAILETFKIKYLEKQFDEFFTAFGEASEDGLSESEINSLRNQFNSNIDEAKEGFEQFNAFFEEQFGEGLAGGGEASSSLAGSIKASLTEETGEILAGTINSIRLIIAEQLEAQDIMISSLEIIANNSQYLGRLENIENLLTEQSARSEGL